MLPPKVTYLGALALAAALTASVVSVGGCASLRGNHSSPAPEAPSERPEPDTSLIAPDLEMMQSLAAGDPARQAEIFQAVKDAATLNPTIGTRLKYALALATPAHAGSDPVAAQRQLSQLLATPETLAPVERLLATVQLQEIDQRLILLEEDKQLREDAPREARDKLLALNHRLSTESDENARLRKALEEAEAKLEAVTHIERSINDRGTNGSHTP
jgi:hypothetical protein